MAQKRQLSGPERQEFDDNIVDQFPDRCVLDRSRLCHNISSVVSKLEYMYEQGRITEEDATEQGGDRALAAEQYCKGQELDGTRTKCNFGVIKYLLPSADHLDT